MSGNRFQIIGYTDPRFRSTELPKALKYPDADSKEESPLPDRISTLEHIVRDLETDTLHGIYKDEKSYGGFFSVVKMMRTILPAISDDSLEALAQQSPGVLTRNCGPEQSHGLIKAFAGDELVSATQISSVKAPVVYIDNSDPDHK